MRVIDANTVEVEVSYTEPTKDTDTTISDSDNPALLDLAYTSVFYKIGTAATVSAGSKQASAPTGGGEVKSLLIVPAKVNAKTSIDFWATSTDLTGNSSGETHALFVVDRMAPVPPSSFLVA